MKDNILNTLLTLALVAMAVGIPLVVLDTIFGAEEMTYWVAGLVS